MNPLFSIQQLTFTYPRMTAPALAEVSLAVEPGEFLVLCGPSGCGKSTLLRQLKPVLTPHGVRDGEIFFMGRPLEKLSHREQAEEIGFVLQSPENQAVTDKVWHELAFGLESLGYDTPAIRRRVAEMASFFGIQGWFYQNVADLSGGQKQLLNLASVMALQPRVLILDEPTSQLDPIAAGDFLGALGKLNRELGVTVLLAEQRLEEAFPLASRAVVMDGGHILCQGVPREVGQRLRETRHGMFAAMPTPMRVWAATDSGEPCPVTVREGRRWLEDFAQSHTLRPLPEETARPNAGETALTAEDVWFRYEKGQPDVVKGLALTVKEGEFLALLGGNGTGKTTVLKLLAGLSRPYRGEVQAHRRVGLLPQDPKTLFVKKTLREDLLEILGGRDLDKPAQRERLEKVVKLCQLESLLARHPYDLSGGEQQRAALAKILLLEPEILLLDEPTKGLDGAFKVTLGGILDVLLTRGAAVVMVSHDVEFCAQYAHRCALLFDGNVVTSGSPRDFFAQNSFYTTAANRMARGIVPQAVTVADLVAVCGGVPTPRLEIPDWTAADKRAEIAEKTGENNEKVKESAENPPDRGDASWKPPKLPWWRRGIAAICAAVAAVPLFHFMGAIDLGDALTQAGLTNGAARQATLYGVFAASLVILGLAVGRRRPPPAAAECPRERRKLPRRTLVAAALVLLLIPLTLLVGVFYLADQKYYFISLLVLLECMLPFFMVFEGRKPQARELVVISVLCALGVAGRQVFFMLPEFKPVAALVIISGVAFGGETGFLVGAVTMLVSNILFGQGPWTPWQMFAMGIIGFLAGALFRKGLLRRTRGAMCVFGAVSVLVLYGGIMNLQSALLVMDGFQWQTVAAYLLSGLPMDCVHAAATWVFLWFAGEPMLEKLDRARVKYGLVE